MKTILEVIGMALMIYVLGFLVFVASVANGYKGGDDMLTRHYGNVLQIIK